MLENATEALDLILISSISDIVILDFEEAVVLEMESIFVASQEDALDVQRDLLCIHGNLRSSEVFYCGFEESRSQVNQIRRWYL
jgi:hypothetical protein